MDPTIPNGGVIGAYVNVCKELTEEQFCERGPYPFLLHSTETGPIVPTDKTRGITIDRLVLSDDPKKRGLEKLSQKKAYTVFVLNPRNPKDNRVTVGCSSTCDVQINDESVSTLHAYLEREDTGYFIRDNESAAGTQVNDTLLDSGESRELSPGDRITLGLVDLMFLTPAKFYHFVRRFFRMQTKKPWTSRGD